MSASDDQVRVLVAGIGGLVASLGRLTDEIAAERRDRTGDESDACDLATAAKILGLSRSGFRKVYARSVDLQRCAHRAPPCVGKQTRTRLIFSKRRLRQFLESRR